MGSRDIHDGQLPERYGGADMNALRSFWRGPLGDLLAGLAALAVVAVVLSLAGCGGGDAAATVAPPVVVVPPPVVTPPPPPPVVDPPPPPPPADPPPVIDPPPAPIQAVEFSYAYARDDGPGSNPAESSIYLEFDPPDRVYIVEIGKPVAGGTVATNPGASGVFAGAFISGWQCTSDPVSAPGFDAVVSLVGSNVTLDPTMRVELRLSDGRDFWFVPVALRAAEPVWDCRP